MELIPTNPILEFNTNQLRLVRKQYNLDKPGEMSRAIDVLEAWVKMQNHFMKKDLPRCFLETVIIASKGSLERAKQRIDKICTFRTVMPTFFGENLMNCKVDDLDNIFNCLVLPKPTQDNYRVFVMKVIGSEFTTELLITCYRYVVLLCEYVLANDYIDGVVIILDYNEANVLELVKALNLTDMRQIISIVTEGFGMRVKGIHLVTPSKAIETLVSIFKQFLSPKLGKRICTHKDTSTLFQHVPKELFPMEYGGKEKSLIKIRDEVKRELTGKTFMNYIKEIGKAKTDESHRQTDTFNEQYLGTPGSFRTLTVD